MDSHTKSFWPTYVYAKSAFLATVRILFFGDITKLRGHFEIEVIKLFQVGVRVFYFNSNEILYSSNMSAYHGVYSLRCRSTSHNVTCGRDLERNHCGETLRATMCVYTAGELTTEHNILRYLFDNRYICKIAHCLSSIQGVSKRSRCIISSALIASH